MIKAEHLSKKYGQKSVLEDINFQVSVGERVAIVGKNGCGKTTLMQILSGIIKPDAGTVIYFGKNAWKEKSVFREFCGFVPQENPLMEELSVKDNLRLWGAAVGKGYQDLIGFFQLEEMMNMKVWKLSGGMKRRVSIACALIGWPPVLLLDEPMTALDLYYKESIRELLNVYQKMNGIVLMTTHDEIEILNSDRCFVMNAGRLMELKKSEIDIQKIKEYMEMHEAESARGK